MGSSKFGIAVQMEVQDSYDDVNNFKENSSSIHMGSLRKDIDLENSDILEIYSASGVIQPQTASFENHSEINQVSLNRAYHFIGVYSSNGTVSDGLNRAYLGFPCFHGLTAVTLNLHINRHITSKSECTCLVRHLACILTCLCKPLWTVT